MPAGSLQLVVPGLLPTLARFATSPELPALGRLLARSRHRAGFPSDTRQLLHLLFGHSPGEVPVGAVARFGDGAEADDGCWLCATPVHLLPQRDQVQLVVAEDVSPQEAAALADEVNGWYGEEGWWLEARAQRLYLRAPGDCTFSADPPEALHGRPINERLPEGPGRLTYHRFLSELEMLIHASPINQAREARGAPTLGGLWLWGAGRLPTAGRLPSEAVFADDPFARGLVRLAGGTVRPLPAGLDGVESPALVVLPSVPDSEPLAWLRELERGWCAPLTRALSERRFGAARLFPGCGIAAEASGRTLWRIWQRQDPSVLARRLCG